MMPRMTTFGMALRLVAITLVVVLMVTIATPEKAEAMDPFTIMAILGAAAVVAIIIAYLVVANTRGPKVDHPEQKISPEHIQPVAHVTGFATPPLAPQS